MTTRWPEGFEPFSDDVYQQSLTVPRYLDAMPFDYQISPDDNLVTIRLSGAITETEILAPLHALRTDPGYHLDMHRLWDFRAVTETIIELNRMPGLKGAVAAVSRSGRTAFVVARSVDEIATQYFRLYVKERPIQVFRDMDAARAWLLGP